MKPRLKNIVLGVTASVAIYKACDLVRCLRDKGLDVKVVMTPDAQKLISPALFASLSGNKVYCQMFEDPAQWEIEHVSLASWAGCLVVAPATANIIAKMSAGICDDLLTCVACATKAPVLVCPAMNKDMYTHALTQQNIDKLKAIGYRIVAPRCGKLACGTEGIGCLAEVQTIVEQICKVVSH